MQCSALNHVACCAITALCHTAPQVVPAMLHSTCDGCAAAGVGGGRRRKTLTEWPHTEAVSSRVPEGSKVRRERG